MTASLKDRIFNQYEELKEEKRKITDMYEELKEEKRKITDMYEERNRRFNDRVREADDKPRVRGYSDLHGKGRA